MVSRECVLATKTIKMYGVDRQYQNLKHEVLDITDRILSTGQVLDGACTTAFELEIAQQCHRRYAVTVNSATQGLIFALRTAPLVEKSGVLIPAVSFIATLNAAMTFPGNIRMCDIDHTALMDLSTVEDPLRDQVNVIMYANLFGNTVDWDRFQIMADFFTNGKMFVIEDAAQSFGASFNGVPSGKMGNISVLSFDPTKNLNNFGSGGMVLTDDEDVAISLKNLKDNGKTTGYEIPGTNSKMSEVDCAIMRVKLKKFDSWQARRTEIAEYYTQELQGLVATPHTTPGAIPAWSKYVIRARNRNKLKQHLAYNDIESKITYSRPLYSEFVGRAYIPTNTNNETNWEAEKFTRECLSLPIYPELYDGEVERVVKTIREYFR